MHSAVSKTKLIDVALGRGNQRIMDIVLISITGASLILSYFTIEKDVMRAVAIAICGLLNFTIFTYLCVDQRLKAIVELVGGEEKLTKS